MQTIQSKKIEGNISGKAFGDVLRRLRQDNGLSQEVLGFESGYHRTYISLLERGKKSPSLQTVFNLSKALKIEPAELIKQVEVQVHVLLQTTNNGAD
jgi:transcriptional regulator with XRE-family HTH domain